jgi:tRNA nucleotidyltransferase (CCA-adding enzyme)
MKHNSLIQQIAEDVRDAGGRALLVGGCVRDELMKQAVKDVDIEVYGLQPIELKRVLEGFGKVDEVGASFQVFKLMNDFDISIPRREKKTGTGHKGFTVEGDPFMSYEEACSRRDFTINAIMKDPLTGEIIDPFNGQQDIERKVLRMVTPAVFKEDSLRVLRLAQFASRFGFWVEEDTQRMAQETDLSDLPKERIWMELEKMFLKSPLVNIGVELILELKIADKLFPSLKYTNTVQNALLCADYTDLDNGEKLAVLVTLLTLDSNDIVLDELGLSSVAGYNVRKQVEALRKHLPKGFLNSDYEFHKLSQHVQMKLAARVLCALGYGEEFTKTIKRLGIENEPIKPVVTGKYLIEYGMKPSVELGKLLTELYDYQMQGWTESALFSYARSRCGFSEVGV